MVDMDATTIRDWLGVTEHGDGWRRAAILQYRENLMMKLAYKDLTDDEFVSMMESSFADRRRRDE